MPTNRRRKLRRLGQGAISPRLRAFFESGTDSKGLYPDDVWDVGDIFLLRHSPKTITEGWLPYREMFLKDWKAKKRRGLPYAEKMRFRYEREKTEFEKWQNEKGSVKNADK